MNMFRRKSVREIIIESSVIISSLLIFFGFLKQYWFFDFFGIKIQQYLGLDEVLILFLGELPFVIKLIIYSILYFVSLQLIFKIYCFFIDRKEKKSTKTEHEINKSLDDFVNDESNNNFMFYLSFSFNVICLLLFNYFHSEASIIYLALMSGQTVLILLEVLKVNLDRIFRDALLIFYCLSIMLYCKNKIDIDSILTQAKSTKYIINLKQEKICTSSNILYIGKTKEYLFLYNNFKKETRIVKNDDIKETNIYVVKN